MRISLAVAVLASLAAASSVLAQEDAGPGASKAPVMNGEGVNGTGAMPPNSRSNSAANPNSTDNGGRPGGALNGPGNANTRNNGG